MPRHVSTADATMDDAMSAKHSHTRQASILSMRRYYAKNRDKELQRFKEYYRKNKDRIRAYKKRVREQTKCDLKHQHDAATHSPTRRTSQLLHDILSPTQPPTTTHRHTPPPASAKFNLAFLLN
ncbi:hypothetical protein H310_12669 [Aphanomyces invadans]|uniref:Uncharacterized protein n=1 Tax=Aphanomyces invadans TaxID=157072 RepID=A0A024THI2_9STRA|nr:hypothetical protein H310_12669 [Aphanomyces invadans]ETV93424.1 hypothetical protein H310_12669 [Aphanomyces invadans]RHY24031.1 hypothetical protein DYB32_008998 [Aphanomyces invadans]|eukprot:XP_008878060.1 hypothetical protein H310_12669 [Aphanomyces invadans]